MIDILKKPPEKPQIANFQIFNRHPNSGHISRGRPVINRALAEVMQYLPEILANASKVFTVHGPGLSPSVKSLPNFMVLFWAGEKYAKSFLGQTLVVNRSMIAKMDVIPNNDQNVM